jgi:hypothetical protein
MDYNSSIELIIKGSQELYYQLSTGKKIEDFTPGDLVKCSYIKGIFRVSEVFRTKVEVFPIDNTSDIFQVGPNFLRKIDINQDSVKILYGKKLT